MRTEIWVVDSAGPLVTHVPHGVGLVTLGGLGSKWENRRLAGIAAMNNLARAFRGRRPKVALSAGNHFHITASAAYIIAGSPNSVRLVFRASNPPFRGRDIRIGAVLAWLYRLRFRGARRIISVSAELGDILVKTVRLDPSRVVTIANSIDLEAASKRAAEVPGHPWFAAGEPPVILGIGRLAPQKNFSLLIRAFARVRQATPSRLAIIGDGTGKELLKLKALAASLGLTPTDVWFAGRQANPLKFLSHAELFVLSSHWEGMSNVLLEAMACGCPIVATDCPTGVRELLEGGRFGAIVPVSNVDAMAQAIVAKLSEAPNRELIRREASRYDRKQAMGRYVAILREEMAQAKPLEEQSNSK